MTPTDLPSWASKLIVLAALGATPVAASDVVEVPDNHPTLQQAVDAAADGSIVLVRPDSFNQTLVIDGKSLSIIADGNPNPAVEGDPQFVVVPQVIVRNLASDQTVSLYGIEVLGAGDDAAQGAVRLLDNAGPVVLRACRILGRDGGFLPSDNGTPYIGGHGVAIANGAATLLVNCHVEAGNGGQHGTLTGAGGDGLTLTDSAAALYGCDVSGGIGAAGAEDGNNSGNPGGHGLSNHDSFVLVSASDLRGGAGGCGDCDFFPSSCGFGGDGGHGLLQLGASAHTTLARAQLTGSAGGCSFGSGADGFPGVPLAVGGGGTLLEIPDSLMPSLSAPGPVREGELATVSIRAAHGAMCGLFLGVGPGFGPLAPPAAVLHASAQLLVLGPVPPVGPLVLSATVPELGAGIEGVEVTLQSVIAIGADVHLGMATTMVFLDAGI